MSINEGAGGGGGGGGGINLVLLSLPKDSTNEHEE